MTETKPTKLFNRNFVLLWQGQFVSQLGSQAFSIAMMFWIKHTTGSATLMGLLMMTASLPGAILGPIGGTIADQYSRRKIIIFSDLTNGVCVLALSALIVYFSTSTNLILVALFVVSLVLGIVGAFFMPSISAAIPDLVPKESVASANSLSQSTMQISMLIGQGIGGVLYRILGAPVLFLIDGLTYLFSAASESLIQIPQEIPEKSAGLKEKFGEFKAEMKEGFRYVWQRKGMRELFAASAFLNFFAMPFMVLFPFYVEDVLNQTVDWYGFLLAAAGFGSLLGYAVAGAIKISGKMRTALLITCLVLLSLGWGILGFITIPLLALFIVCFSGILGGIFNINVITILQLEAPAEIRGRVFGLLNTLAMGLAPLSMGLAGIVADLFDHNIPLIFLACGVIMAVLSLAVAINRNFRAFLASE